MSWFWLCFPALHRCDWARMHYVGQTEYWYYHSFGFCSECVTWPAFSAGLSLTAFLKKNTKIIKWHCMFAGNHPWIYTSRWSGQRPYCAFSSGRVWRTDKWNRYTVSCWPSSRGGSHLRAFLATRLARCNRRASQKNSSNRLSHFWFWCMGWNCLPCDFNCPPTGVTIRLNIRTSLIVRDCCWNRRTLLQFRSASLSPTRCGHSLLLNPLLHFVEME